MRFVGQDQLIFREAAGRVEYVLFEPDKSHVTRFPNIITFLSHDVKNKYLQLHLAASVFRYWKC